MTPSPGSPNVFIIESLSLADEKADRREGEILSQMLRLSSDKASEYYYIRTRRELAPILKEFARSDYRYLHLSCHGNSAVMGTTLDQIPFAELGTILRPYIDKRRVFLSACGMATTTLARELLPKTTCYSLIGPSANVTFGDAALLWASFYHLMFRADASVMKHERLAANLRSTVNLFAVPMNYFRRSSNSHQGYRFQNVSPSRAA